MTIELPTTEQIELMSGKDLVITYNHFASTAGQNPVKKFETREKGIKRLTAVADALRAKGITEPTVATEFPLIVKAPETSQEQPTSAGDAPAPAVSKPVTAPAKASADVVLNVLAPGNKSLIAGMSTKAKNELAESLKKTAPAKKEKSIVQKTGLPHLAVRLRDLINQQPPMDNAAIWAIVKEEYNLDDNKRGYVAGQRRAMAKKGE